jgi:hypothetical protein
MIGDRPLPSLFTTGPRVANVDQVRAMLIDRRGKPFRLAREAHT